MHMSSLKISLGLKKASNPEMTLLWLGLPDLIKVSLERVIQAERKET